MKIHFKDWLKGFFTFLLVVAVLALCFVKYGQLKRDFTCQGNLKLLSQAINYYCHDNDGYYPSYIEATDSRHRFNTLYSQLNCYVPREKNWFCPAVSQTRRPGQGFISYMSNLKVISIVVDPSTTRKVKGSDIQFPHQTPLLFDGILRLSSFSGIDFIPDFRHEQLFAKNRINILFANGLVKSMAKSEIDFGSCKQDFHCLAG